MSDVPSDVYRTILLRVPAESLIRCRAVCRAWCFIIDDPSFIKSHTLTRHSSSSILLISDPKCRRLYSLSLHSLTYAYHAQQTVDLTRVKNLVRRSVPRLGVLPPITCHGLILLDHFDLMKDWVIWNPLTRDLHRLYYPEDKGSLRGVGLGYDYAADDYKVVSINKMYGVGESVCRTCFYSLKSRTWKVIKDCPQCAMIWRSIGVYLNGALHWINNNSEIVSLDLATEEYGLLPLPSKPVNSLSRHLYALDGFLFITHSYRMERVDGFPADDCFDVWIMNDDIDISVGTPWIKLLSLVNEDSVGNATRFTFLSLIAYSKSSGVIIMQNDFHIYCYDIRKKCKEVTIRGLPECFTCHCFQGSLVRLVDGTDTAMDISQEHRRCSRRKSTMPSKYKDFDIYRSG